ncbi:hypothetical protein JTB14_027649 [Gonioctena quinquepunctata]|nr:hypothetical protein JTB14_027649 [Gonioctena quinquepunctata]
MKVELATQTLSSSVADAIEFLKDDLKVPDFQSAGPTIHFLRMVDIAFDILNSRSPVAKGSRNGWNNNPNALQMQHTYRKLLFHAQVKGIGGNCSVINSTTILALPSNINEKNSREKNSFIVDYSVARKYNIDENELFTSIEDHD